MPPRYRHLFEDFDFPVSCEEVGGELEVEFDGDAGTDLAIEAGKPGTWTITLRPGSDLVAGDTVAFARELPSRGFEGYRLALRPQTVNPRGVDFVTADAGAGAEIELVANRFNVKGREIALVRIVGGGVPGDGRLVLRVGDTSGGGPGSYNWPVARMGCNLRSYLNRPGQDSYSPYSQGVRLRSRPSTSAGTLQVVVPSDVMSGEPFDLRVAVRDGNYNLLEEYGGKIRVESAGGGKGFSEEFQANSSVVEIPLEAGEPGVRWVRVSAGDISRLSNPFRVHESDPLTRTYWGDIHAHCYDASEIKVLDEMSSPRSVLLSGRDVNLIDVCAASPHFFPAEAGAIDMWWDLLNDSCRELNQDGSFVTFPCLEYRGQGGDRNLLFREERRNPPHMDQTLEPIWRLSPGEVSVLPHVGGGTSDWSLHRPILEPSAEIASAHGNSEWFLQEGLQRGAVVGIHASSDGHNRTAGHPRHVQMGGGRFGDLNRRDCSYGGASLAAFNSPALDRTGIWESLSGRNTYGSTGARMLMNFEIDGFRMGSILAANRPPRISARVAGNSPISRLEIVRDDRLLHVHRGRKLTESTAARDEGIQPGRHYYYLRATQLDGEIAWSSPIWVNYDGEKRRATKLPPWNRQELPHRKRTTRRGESELGRLLAYLEREEEERFHGIRWSHEVDSPQGHCHYFVGHDRDRGMPVHVKWYTDFPDERLRVDTGWRDYGQWGRSRRGARG